MSLKIQKKKKNETRNEKEVRLLIIVNILGSSGPIKFVVNEDDNVSIVIEKVLKIYARQGRLPDLGYNIGNFILYRVNAGSEALKLSETIGSTGERDFVLRKKQNKPQMTEARSGVVTRKLNDGRRTWLNKSCVFQCIIPLLK